MSDLFTLNVITNHREELIDITGEVEKAITELQMRSGLLVVFVPHTTAGLLINENADPSVKEDVLAYLRHKVPRNDGYRHAEGNSDAHIKAILVGTSQLILVQHSRPVLGTWQSIYFAEFDGPRCRKVMVGTVHGHFNG